MKTSKILCSALLALLALSTVETAKADQLVECYIAYISEADKYNSRGQRLTSPAAILRQDRANFHRFGRGDLLDQSDRFFGCHDNRASLERLLERGYTCPTAARSIVHGNPLAMVQIYRTRFGDTYVRVTLAE